MVIQLLSFLECKIANYKKRYSFKKDISFLNKHNLSQSDKSVFSLSDYNGYQSTPIILCESLVKSGVIKKTDKIIDIGCGCGIFLCYLLSHGFEDVTGIEVDPKLYKIALKNIEAISKDSKKTNAAKIFNCDFFKFDNIDNYSVFYIFNSFNSQELYLSLLNKIKESTERKPRRIKIIFLYLTIYSKKALLQSDWIRRTKKIVDKRQTCYQCINHVIYENV